MAIHGFGEIVIDIDVSKVVFVSTRTIARADWFEGQFTDDELKSIGINANLMKEIDDNYHRPTLSRLFFNCWHMNDDESDAMWKIYVNGTGGVAISSSTARLKQCFKYTAEDVSIGKIKYATGDHGVHVDHPVQRYMRKRPAFAHEQEVRIVYYDENELYNDDCGVLLHVDVPTLIERVVVSPKAEKWFLLLVKEIVAELGYEFEIVASDGTSPA